MITNDQLLNEEKNSESEYPINEEYTLYSNQLLGSGSFGFIYKGISIKTNQEFAFKMEPNNAPTFLSYEYKILKHLQGGIGIPNVYFIKNLPEDTVIVMDLLGPNLQEILQNTKAGKFRLKTVLMIGDQMISRFNYIHDKGVIHRDLKLENVLVGTQTNQAILYLIDFGLSKRYIDLNTNKHIPQSEGREITGTVRYVSINTHKGIEQSRRDDIEALGYSLIYLLNGELPWVNIKSKTNEEKKEKILEKKLEFKEGLGNYNLFEEFISYFEYVYNLSFTEKPNYMFLKGLMAKLLTKSGYYNDWVFDWNLIELINYPISMIKELEREKKEKRIEEDLKKEDIKEDESPNANLNKINQKGATSNSNNKAKKSGTDNSKVTQPKNKPKGKSSIIKLSNKTSSHNNNNNNSNNNNKQFGSSLKK